MIGVVTVAATVVVVPSACLGDELTPTAAPTSTLAPVAPSTTLVPVELGEGERPDSERVSVHAAPMLDGETHVLRSDDPATPFLDGEPAELRRIHELAIAGDCEQLHDTLDFWLRFIDDAAAVDDTDDDDTDDDTDDDDRSAARRTSVFARAAFDAIAFIECGPRP